MLGAEAQEIMTLDYFNQTAIRTETGSCTRLALLKGVGSMRSTLLFLAFFACAQALPLHAQDGPFTKPFADRLIPVLHDMGELKPHSTFPPPLLAKISDLDKLATTDAEKSLMAFMKDELTRYIQTEKRPAQTAKRQQCLQDLTGQAKRLQYKVTDACGDISNSMYGG